MAVVAYGGSFPAPRNKLAQLGFYTVATTLETGGAEALNDACRLAWGIAVKTSATSGGCVLP